MLRVVGRVTPVQLGGWRGLLRVEASIAVDGGEEGRDGSAWASSGEEDVTMGILGDEGEPGVEAGSEEATCRQRATKESMKMLQTEERTKECDSRGELGDMGVVAGDGAESQDQEVRAQRYRRELGEEERRHRRGTPNVCYIPIVILFLSPTCRNAGLQQWYGGIRSAL